MICSAKRYAVRNQKVAIYSAASFGIHFNDLIFEDNYNSTWLGRKYGREGEKAFALTGYRCLNPSRMMASASFFDVDGVEVFAVADET